MYQVTAVICNDCGMLVATPDEYEAKHEMLRHEEEFKHDVRTVQRFLCESPEEGS